MTPEQFARIDKIHGYMSEDELRWLWGQASRSISVLEIGVFKGRTTTALCLACPGMVISVDNWMGSPKFDDDTREMVKNRDVRLETMREAFGNLQQFREDRKLVIFPMDSRMFFICVPQVRYDFAFIDGSHDEETVYAEIDQVRSRCAPTGMVIAGHDYNTSFPGVMKAVDRHFPQVNRGANSAGSIWWVQV